uniref:Uncharacterized protein n=1 Tax=Aegilops tauschii subsp. strangulata TaxID=200361 RepID=A0A453CD71_AEGTS
RWRTNAAPTPPPAEQTLRRSTRRSAHITTFPPVGVAPPVERVVRAPAFSAYGPSSLLYPATKNYPKKNSQNQKNPPRPGGICSSSPPRYIPIEEIGFSVDSPGEKSKKKGGGIAM